MKKLIKSFVMLSMASLVVLSSCDDETTEDIRPVEITIAATPSTTNLNFGTPLQLTLSLAGNPDNKLKKVTVTSSASNVALLTKTLSGQSATEIVRDTIRTIGAITYTVTLEGEKGTAVTKSYKVTGIALPGGLDVSSNARSLFGQTQDSASTYFMSLTDPFTPFTRGRVEIQSNKSSIDVGFYFGNTNKATLASPSDALLQSVYTYVPWSTVAPKATKLFKTSLTAAQYDAIVTSNSDSAIIALAADVTSWGSAATNLTNGNVVLYQTAEGVLGLIKVENLSGTQASDAEIQISAACQD